MPKLSKRPKTLDEATTRRIAVEADVDPRTVLRELREPGSVRGMSGERARTALIKRGLIRAGDTPPGEGRGAA